ncbi:MAG: 3-deoxy-manno-octulosonate cytidylyltransferase [Bacteroidetes bacterium]|nr:3-deoxy-manno-octulosonate cytidylyltransferase [Bacteroidota bacterium]
MKILGVIPARWQSSRFPGKPLADVGGGKTFLEHLYTQCKPSPLLNELVIATDDERIRQAAEGFGAKVLMVAGNFRNGTERCWAVAEQMPQYDAVVNIQCDEFFVNAEQLNLLAACLSKVPEETIVTLIKPITTQRDMDSPDTVKVVRQKNGYALYFSRSVIPFLSQEPDTRSWLLKSTFYKHIGVYGFWRETLRELAALPPSALENAESLEQLRWQENDYSIYTATTLGEAVSIDTPQDLEYALKVLRGES